MKVPVPAGEEVAPKLVRLFYFVAAGIVVTTVTNKWNDYEKKSAIEKQQQLNVSSLDNQTNPVQKAVE